MEREALRQMLREKLEADAGEKIASLADTVNLRTDLGLDSVDFVQMVFHIQDEYGILIESKELESVACVGDFLDLLQAKLAGAKKPAA